MKHFSCHWQNKTGLSLKVVDDFGLFVQLPDVHHPLGELSPTSINHLVPQHHLPPEVNGLLWGSNTNTFIS